MKEIIKVVLIDDDGDDRYYFTKLLTTHKGRQFDINCFDSLDAYTSSDPTTAPDVVLLDLYLMASVGLETVDAAMQVFPNSPIIVLTSLDSEAAGEAALERGAQDFLGKSELTAQQLARSIWYAAERYDLVKKLKYQAITDSLTSLPNRSHFFSVVEHELSNAKRHCYKVAIVTLDLDGFKQINDQYGHPCGDGVLVAFANKLKSVTRESDIAARLGGDEFVLMLSHINDRDQLIDSCNERLSELSFTETILVDGKQVDVEINSSIGVALYPDHAGDINKLISISDQCLYMSKRKGKNKISVFDDSQN